MAHFRPRQVGQYVDLRLTDDEKHMKVNGINAFIKDWRNRKLLKFSFFIYSVIHFDISVKIESYPPFLLRQSYVNYHYIAMPPVFSRYVNVVGNVVPIPLVPDFDETNVTTIKFSKMIDGVKKTVPVPLAYGSSVEEAIVNLEALARAGDRLEWTKT